MRTHERYQDRRAVRAWMWNVAWVALMAVLLVVLALVIIGTLA